ncbi:MAG TPA: hypothetical protein VIV15_04530, partial [Anaerolineales bacterium]
MKFNIDATTKGFLQKLGGMYVPFAVILVQLLAFLIGPSFLVSQNVARFPADQFAKGMGISAIMALAGILVAGIWGYFGSRDARSQLDHWRASGDTITDPGKEASAWRNINSLTLRFIPVSFAIFLIGQFLPVAGYLYLVHHISWNPIIYILLATLACTIGGTALAVLILEILLRPARQVLLPTKFEAQLQGSGKFSLTLKLMGIAGALTFLSILLIGPIGYRHTLLAATSAETAGQTLLSFQVQSLLATLVMVVLGFLMAFLIVRALNEPIRSMINS